MSYVERRGGIVVGVYAKSQPGYAEEWLDEGHPDLTAKTPEQIAKEALREAEQLAADELKADTKFQNLIEKTPQQAKNWCENNFPSLTLAEQRDLATIVMAVGILGRRL